MPTAAETQEKRRVAREVVDVLQEISLLLNTNLDRTQLSLSISLIENGVNPEALATVIKELRKHGKNGERQLDSGEERSD